MSVIARRAISAGTGCGSSPAASTATSNQSDSQISRWWCGGSDVRPITDSSEDGQSRRHSGARGLHLQLGDLQLQLSDLLLLLLEQLEEVDELASRSAGVDYAQTAVHHKALRHDVPCG